VGNETQLCAWFALVYLSCPLIPTIVIVLSLGYQELRLKPPRCIIIEEELREEGGRGGFFVGILWLNFRLSCKGGDVVEIAVCTIVQF
jgi:hypothetical protein